RSRANAMNRVTRRSNSAGGPMGSPETTATPPTTRYARNARSSSLKKYDLSARSAKGASVSAPHAATSERAAARSLASGRCRYRHGASHAVSSHAAAATPRMKTETGNHSPNRSPTWADPPSESPASERLVSRTAKEKVYGWSAEIRFTQRAAAP